MALRCSTRWAQKHWMQRRSMRVKLQRDRGTSAGSKWRVLFFGSDDFSLPHLKALSEHQVNDRLVEHLAVVTMKSNIDVRAYSNKRGLDCHVWPVSADLLKTLNFDLGILVSFGRLIPEEIIAAFPRGVINIHPSLLPRWQGAAPLLHTILSGDRETAISVMKLQPHRFDCGPVILQRRYNLDPEMTSAQLRVKMADEGSKALSTVLSNLDRYTSEELEQQQDLTQATRAPKLTLNHANVNWSDSVDQIDRQYRTLGSVFLLRSQFNGLQCKLMDMEPVENIEALLPTIEHYYPGRQFLPGEQCFLRKTQLLCIKCQDGWVAFRNVGVKKPLTAQGFYNGYLSKNKDLRFDSLEHGLEQFEHWKPSRVPDS